MYTLLKLYVLCAMCTFVTATIFSWQHFTSLDGDQETKLSYNGLKTELLRENGDAITYLVGDVVVTSILASSIEVSYLLEQLGTNAHREERVVYKQNGETGYCHFLAGFCDNNLLPMFAGHNDFPAYNDTYCHVEPGTYHIFKVASKKELDAESMLLNGFYRITVKHFENKLLIGGFNGTFLCDSEK